jgi:hypothetical protein
MQGLLTLAAYSPTTSPPQVPVINHFLRDLERNGTYTGA